MRDVCGAQFIEQMGQQFEVDGLPRIAGRILGHLLLSPEAVSLEAIAESLQVSKASVSQDTRTLERIGTVERLRKPGDRRLYYRIVDSVQEQLTEQRLARIESTLAVLRAGMAAEAAQNEVVERRLRSFCEFFEQMAEAIERTRSQWLSERGTTE
ncbi:MAG: MarR family transcriptional regulator [Gemmatimonadota bacterium]